jgi:hypothetical protein
MSEEFASGGFSGWGAIQIGAEVSKPTEEPVQK